VKLLSTSFVLLGFLLNSSISYAESTGYEVEVIIFSYLNNRYSTSENWPEIATPKEAEVVDLHQEASTENNSTTKELINEKNNSAETTTADTLDTTEEVISSPIDLTKEAEYLSAEHYRLTKQAERIQHSKNYNLLIHKAWKQAGLPQEQSFSVTVNSQDTEHNAQTTEEKPNSENILINTPKPIYVQGEIRLVMSRYLHISVDLNLHDYENKKSTDDNIMPAQIVEKIYNINLERRMKSKEVNFIDHPLMGILVLATPFKIIDETEDSMHSLEYKTLN